jgi:uncharacterized protein with PIN domain
MSKCPKCEKTLSRLVAVSVPVVSGTTSINGSVFTCPSCHTILGAGVDPQTVVDTTAAKVIAILRKG